MLTISGDVAAKNCKREVCIRPQKWGLYLLGDDKRMPPRISGKECLSCARDSTALRQVEIKKRKEKQSKKTKLEVKHKRTVKSTCILVKPGDIARCQ
jgi:hypothetical protein